jgi:hypothetical protein
MKFDSIVFIATKDMFIERIRRPKKEAFDALIHGQKGRFRLNVPVMFQ